MRPIAAILFAGALSVSLAEAQDVRFSVGPQAGIAISAFEDTWKDFYGIGYGGGVHVDADIVRFFSARLNIEYYTFGSDKEKLKPLLAPLFNLQTSDIASLSGGNISAFIVAMEALGKIPTKSLVTPYALFGLGIHTISLSDLSGSDRSGRSATLTADDVKFNGGTKFGLDFGLGFEFRVNRAVALTMEFKYVLVFTENNSNAAMPITIGANFHL
jgi:opacity protein-like surface antigen